MNLPVRAWSAALRGHSDFDHQGDTGERGHLNQLRSLIAKLKKRTP
jgi:hypothetical protein